MPDLALIPDLSEHQVKLPGGGADYSRVDFAKLSKVVKGAILRIQYGYSHPDFAYTKFVEGCKANGIPFQSYAYFAGVSIPDALAEAKSAGSKVDKDSEILWVDVEEQTCKNPADLVPAVQAYIDYLKQQGIEKVGLYSYEGFYNANGLSAIKADARWIAKYGVNNGQPNTPPALYCDLWQFTSNGKLDGVAGAVDVSIIPSNGQKPLSYFTGKTEQVPVSAAPVNVPVTSPTPLMVVKVLVDTDVRAEPSHTSGYIGDVHPGKTYNVWAHQGDWHYIIFDEASNTCGWVDGNNGQNLYWLDNPALQSAPAAPQPVYYTVVSGDTVSKIVAKFGSTPAQIKTWNGLADVNLIKVGQKLRVK